MKDKNKANGFTLIELLIAMVIALLLMTAIYSTYRTQQKAYLVQDQVVGMQQNLRAAMNLVERDFRMIAYDPNQSANTRITIFTEDSDDEKGFSDSITYTMVDDETDEIMTIRYELDDAELLDDPDSEGEKDSEGNPIKDDLVRTSNGNKEVIAQNIQVFDLVGLDKNGVPLDSTASDFEPKDIRSIEITLVGRTLDTGADWQDKNYSNSKIFANSQGDIVLKAQNDNLRRMIITKIVRCRNLGLTGGQ